VIVLFSWALMFGVGFALIYYPSYPWNFHNASSQAAPQNPRLGLSLYIALQALTGASGDLTATPAWLRIVIAIQSLLGFALITASVSWIVLLYPPLTRIRALARDVSMFADAERRSGVAVTFGDAEQLLATFAAQVVRARIDFIHFPILYYFHPEEESASLAQAIPHLMRFASEAASSDQERVRLAGDAIRSALDALADVLSEYVRPRGCNSQEVFQAYQVQHRELSAK
jgi:hypothetical protein